MNKNDIAKTRLFNQQIAAPKLTAPDAVVRWFGAMQAQDYPMAKWAVGARLPGSTADEIERAVAEGRILRTHVMRPTWHFIAAEDARWLIRLSAPQLKRTSAATLRSFGLDEAVCRRSQESMARALEGGRHLTRREIMTELARAGLEANNHQAAYLMFYAEIDGLVCSGAKRGKDQTYALLDERVPPLPPGAELTRDEAIAELARRYFTSHAPATLKDFIWWSGLPTADARKGLEMNRANLVSREIEGVTYWLPESLEIPGDEAADSLYLLPAFDEFMVSYKDRSAALDPHLSKEAVTGNGIFKPIIVAGQKVRGIWKRSYKKDSVIVEKTLFDDAHGFDHAAFQAKAREYARFEGKNAITK